EIDRMMMPVYEQYLQLYSGETLIKKLEEARQNAIEKMMQDSLILSEARKLNIEVSDKDVEARIDEMRKRLGSQNKLSRALLEQNMTLKELRGRYREQLMVRKLIDQKVGFTVTITPVEISDYYYTHKDDFVQPEQLKLSNILIRPEEDESADKAYDLAVDILKRLREGGDFATLAKEYSEGPNASEGGSMGYVKKGDLMPEIEKAVFNMNQGEVSDILQTSLGYHIFKVDEKSERKIIPLSEVRRDIEDAVFRQKANVKLKGWLETLKKNAYIAFK
ncbi:MAG: peptidylprolyl isomerase, partial [Candidatus Omnitrophota bacterium]|nr:peptidylprolyl isomerase [Candidatus Omnitrophota bacterium]